MIHHPEMTKEEAAQCRKTEMEALVTLVGGTYQCLGFEDEFLYDNKETRIALIGALRRVKADVIFTHNEYDYNLDHMIVNRLVRQCAMQMAFPVILTDAPPTKGFPAVFMVEPAEGFDFAPTQWGDIDDTVEEKWKAAQQHKSQDEAFKAGFGEEYGIKEWTSRTSSHRGNQCGCSHAEAFRPMMTRGLIKGYSILP